MKVFLWLLLLLPQLSMAASSVWHVSKGEHHLYIGGTIHVLKASDYPLPVEFGQAFALADHLVLETDLAAAKSPQFAAELMARLTYPAGQSLQDFITEETFNKLDEHLQTRGLSAAQLSRFKPVMVALTLTMVDLQRIGMSEIGVDEYFFQQALTANKTLSFLESVDQQLKFIVAMGEGEEDALILSSIDDINRLEPMMNAIKQAWLIGDADQLAAVALAEMQRDYPAMYQSILVDRNNNWLPQLEIMISDPGTELVLVGALHLVGEQGLIQQLRAKGYRVELFQ